MLEAFGCTPARRSTTWPRSPQALSLAFGEGGIAALLGKAAILLLRIRILGAASFLFTGATRLPMTAGGDHLIPAWFTRLHPRYRTPTNSIYVWRSSRLAPWYRHGVNERSRCGDPVSQMASGDGAAECDCAARAGLTLAADELLSVGSPCADCRGMRESQYSQKQTCSNDCYGQTRTSPVNSSWQTTH